MKVKFAYGVFNHNFKTNKRKVFKKIFLSFFYQLLDISDDYHFHTTTRGVVAPRLLFVNVFMFDSQVKLVEQGVGYLMLSGLMTATLALLPFTFRFAQHVDMSSLSSLTLMEVVKMVVGPPDVQTYVFFFITAVLRVCLTGLFFFMMCVAERTYKQVSRVRGNLPSLIFGWDLC